MCGRAPSLLRRQRDQARLLDPAGSGHPKRRAQLERGADQLLLVVRYNTRAGERSLDVMLWGLVPLGLRTSKVGFANINAKAEEIEGRPALREAFQPPGSHGPCPSHFEAGGAAPLLRDRQFADSSVERDGFEPSVPRRKRRGSYRHTRICWCGGAPSNGGYDFYNNAEEGFAGVVRGETCLRSSTRSRVGPSSSSRRIRRALLAGAAFDSKNAREGMDRDRRQQRPRRAAAPAHAARRAVGDRFKGPASAPR